MLKLSRETEYGLRGLLSLAHQPDGQVVQLGQIAGAERLPKSFLAKTFQKLGTAGLVRSHRGQRRGYTLARPATAIRLREILEVINGREVLGRCALWGSCPCHPDQPCLLHSRWAGLRQEMERVFDETTLADLAESSGVVAFPGPKVSGPVPVGGEAEAGEGSRP